MNPIKNFFKRSKKLEVIFISNALGYAGLLPLVILLSLLKLQSNLFQELLLRSFFSYSAVILAFLGAVYWGFALFSRKSKYTKIVLLLSVIPAILGWFTNTLTVNVAIKTLIFFILFNLVFFVELLYAKKIKIPNFYMKLRLKLNILVSIILLLSFF